MKLVKPLRLPGPAALAVPSVIWSGCWAPLGSAKEEKLIVAIQKACEKRPVSTDALEKVVDRVERYVQELGVKEVSSGSIGDRVMEELKALDARRPRSHKIDPLQRPAIPSSGVP